MITLTTTTIHRALPGYGDARESARAHLRGQSDLVIPFKPKHSSYRLSLAIIILAS